MSDMPMALRPVLALDLGGTQLRTALVRPDGTVVDRCATPTPRSTDALVDACVEALAEIRRRVSAQDAPVAVGISAPGPLDPFTGSLIDPPNLPASSWGLPLADRIAEAVGLPATMDKDTNLAVLGEGFFGSAVGVVDFVYITISTGVGGAVVSGGRLLHGPDGVAGELGHLAIDAFDGPLCGCGARGHLEAIASGSGIGRQARAAGLDVDALSARDVAALEDRGDPVAARIMARARGAVAAALVTIVDVFNPDLVIVGGGIAAAEGERLLAPAREAVAHTGFRVQARRARIVAPRLGDDVSLVGAVILANAALDPDLAAYGLRPRASNPGQRTLSTKPVNSDGRPASRANQIEPSRAVATG